jgi:hypothetical protein
MNQKLVHDGTREVMVIVRVEKTVAAMMDILMRLAPLLTGGKASLSSVTWVAARAVVKVRDSADVVKDELLEELRGVELVQESAEEELVEEWVAAVGSCSVAVNEVLLRGVELVQERAEVELVEEWLAVVGSCSVVVNELVKMKASVAAAEALVKVLVLVCRVSKTHSVNPVIHSFNDGSPCPREIVARLQVGEIPAQVLVF